MHRRRVSEPEAMLGAYVGPGWLQLGHLGSNLAILALSWAILEPSWPDLGSLLGYPWLPLGSKVGILA